MRIHLRARAVLSIALSILTLIWDGAIPSAQARLMGTPRPTVHHARRPVARSSSSKYSRYVRYYGSNQKSSRKHRTRHHRRARSAPKVRYAYPLEIFMYRAPEFDRSPLSVDLTRDIREAFENGTADRYPARSLVRAGIASYYPLRGGIFWRRQAVKYIVVHSTETGIPLNAKRVIDSWSSMGRRHPGAQYVVDRDGSIYQAVDPDLATVHVNIFKTLPGINNDNSIGIEMVHTGRQTYTTEQVSSVIRLVTYLQDRYKVRHESIITHRYAQQGDHTDPVAFDWEGFLRNKNKFRNQGLARQLEQTTREAGDSWLNGNPTASTYLQIHGKLTAPKAAATNPSLPAPESRSAVSPAAPMAASSLRGPMELDPQAATVLNTLGQASVVPETAQPTGTAETEKINAARPENREVKAPGQEDPPAKPESDMFVH